MNAADIFSLALQVAPILVALAILAILGAIVASIADATPGGMVPRTMDPAATWR
jgi:VIT1/CCC1 family predicted Fe2+/Mn2+ transporter